MSVVDPGDLDPASEQIATRLEGAGANDSIADLERLRGEVAMFVR